MKYDLPEILIDENTKFDSLFVKGNSRTSTGNLSWTSTTSGTTYDTTGTTYDNQGENGLLLLLKDALYDYKMFADDINGAIDLTSIDSKAWKYSIFKDQLTAQEQADIEANQSLMDIINSNEIKKVADNAVKIANGVWTETSGTIILSASGTYVKRIPLGITAKRGRLMGGNVNAGGIAYFDTDINNGIGFIVNATNTSLSIYSYSNKIIPASSFGSAIDLQSAYIDSNTNELVLTFYNEYTSGAKTLNVTLLKWEVEG